MQKIKIYSIGSNEVNFSGGKKLHSYLKQYLSVNARCIDVIELNVKKKKEEKSKKDIIKAPQG